MTIDEKVKLTISKFGLCTDNNTKTTHFPPLCLISGIMGILESKSISGVFTSEINAAVSFDL